MSEAVTTNIIDGETLAALDLSEIARLIRKTWVDKNGKVNVNYAAKPYLDALAGLSNVSDSYGMDNGKGIVLYFLGNATSYRGPQAKAIKAELKKRIK